jgi:hypothetical protein
MDNPEKLAIKNGESRVRGNKEWTIQSKRQSRMDNPEKLSIKNGQSRETGNIWYTKLETQTNKAKKQKQDSTLYVLDTTILYIIGIRYDTFRLFLLI